MMSARRFPAAAPLAWPARRIPFGTLPTHDQPMQGTTRKPGTPPWWFRWTGLHPGLRRRNRTRADGAVRNDLHRARARCHRIEVDPMEALRSAGVYRSDDIDDGFAFRPFADRRCDEPTIVRVPRSGRQPEMLVGFLRKSER